MWVGGGPDLPRTWERHRTGRAQHASGHNATARGLTLRQLTSWLRDAKVMDGRRVTWSDVARCFNVHREARLPVAALPAFVGALSRRRRLSPRRVAAQLLGHSASVPGDAVAACERVALKAARPVCGPGPQSNALRPGTLRPGGHRPGGHRPGTLRPGAHRPNAHRPNALRPGAHRPGAYRPSALPRFQRPPRPPAPPSCTPTPGLTPVRNNAQSASTCAAGGAGPGSGAALVRRGSRQGGGRGSGQGWQGGAQGGGQGGGAIGSSTSRVPLRAASATISVPVKTPSHVTKGPRIRLKPREKARSQAAGGSCAIPPPTPALPHPPRNKDWRTARPYPSAPSLRVPSTPVACMLSRSAPVVETVLPLTTSPSSFSVCSDTSPYSNVHTSTQTEERVAGKQSNIATQTVLTSVHVLKRNKGMLMVTGRAVSAGGGRPSGSPRSADVRKGTNRRPWKRPPAPAPTAPVIKTGSASVAGGAGKRRGPLPPVPGHGRTQRAPLPTHASDRSCASAATAAANAAVRCSRPRVRHNRPGSARL